LIDWFSMGGNGPFVWGSFAITALALFIETFMLRVRRRAAFAIALEGNGP